MGGPPQQNKKIYLFLSGFTFYLFVHVPKQDYENNQWNTGTATSISSFQSISFEVEQKKVKIKKKRKERKRETERQRTIPAAGTSQKKK